MTQVARKASAPFLSLLGSPPARFWTLLAAVETPSACHVLGGNGRGGGIQKGRAVAVAQGRSGLLLHGRWALVGEKDL